MTNELATNAPAIVDAAKYTAAQMAVWNINHMIISGGGGIAVFKWLEFQLPKWFSAVENYCNTHQGGAIEFGFGKIFGKPIQPAADAAQPTKPKP